MEQGLSASLPWPTPPQAISPLSAPWKEKEPFMVWMPSTDRLLVSPALSTYSCMVLPPSSTASWPNTPLQEFANASSMVCVPCACGQVIFAPPTVTLPSHFHVRS